MSEASEPETPELETTNAGRFFLRVGAWLSLLPYLLTLALVFSGSPTWSGAAYVLAAGLLLAGLMTLPNDKRGVRKVFGKKWPRGLSRAGLIAVFAIMLVRCGFAGEGESLHMLDSARFVDRVVDEQDVALMGMRVLSGGRLLQDDRAELPTAMREAYKQMHEEQGDAPSPFVATYLGLQRPSAYDTVVVEPPASDVKPTTAVIFLHGYAGNFALPCWQISRAIRDLNVVAACPSTDFVGRWESENGEATVRDLVKELRERGITKMVLAGLSNGGYGASELAPKFRNTFAGYVFISGVEDAAGNAGAPVLLFHGLHDSMAPHGEAASYRSKHANARLVSVNAGHFAMLVRSREFDKALRDFVMQTTGASASASRQTVTAGRSL